MNKKYTKITDFMTLLVFAVFAVCVLLVLLYGAQVYQNLVHRGEESFGLRTATQYVSTRVRQAESVTVTDFEGCPALTIQEKIDGTVYVTRVYCCEGFLRELFCAESASLPPEAGEKIIPAESLQLDVKDGMLTVYVDGQRIILSLQGKTGGAP